MRQTLISTQKGLGRTYKATSIGDLISITTEYKRQLRMS